MGYVLISLHNFKYGIFLKLSVICPVHAVGKNIHNLYNTSNLGHAQRRLVKIYYVHPPGGWIYYFCFFRRPASDVRCPASDVRRHAWFPLI